MRKSERKKERKANGRKKSTRRKTLNSNLLIPLGMVTTRIGSVLISDLFQFFKKINIKVGVFLLIDHNHWKWIVISKSLNMLSRLRIGHTRLTHSYILKQEQQPQCGTCQTPLTAKHLFNGMQGFCLHQKPLF